MKQCSKCKRKYPLAKFFKNKSTKDGYQKYCKKCIKESTSKYHNSKKGKEMLKKAQKKYRDSINYNQYRKEYYDTEKGKENILKAIKKYRKKLKQQKKQFKCNRCLQPSTTPLGQLCKSCAEALRKIKELKLNDRY